MDAETKELVEAAEDELRGGEHEGTCTNEGPFDDGPCYTHLEVSERREARLRAAIDKFKASHQ